jgi:TldD protein
VFAPQLSGHRPPLSEQQLASITAGRGELAERINRPVLPAFLSVLDDPAQLTARNRSLIGSYQVDDQGVKAQRVSLIEQGVLKSLLMSRRPRKNLTNSNGHGRGGGAQISNLFIQANDGKTEDELKQEMIKMCKAQSLPFGIVIKTLDRSGGAASDMDGQILMLSGMGGMRRGSISAPMMAYKVYADDGREELFRGITIGEFSVRSLRQITAAGKEGFVLNRLASGGGSPFSFSLGNIPTSIIAPSVLIEEMELRKPSGAQQKPALLTHPYFSK